MYYQSTAAAMPAITAEHSRSSNCYYSNYLQRQKESRSNEICIWNLKVSTHYFEVGNVLHYFEVRDVLKHFIVKDVLKRSCLLNYFCIRVCLYRSIVILYTEVM